MEEVHMTKTHHVVAIKPEDHHKISQLAFELSLKEGRRVSIRALMTEAIADVIAKKGGK
jgi:hypothetical protein